ncbi:MAG TPA: glycoside hydrolase family 43 protein [Puia sp.]|nr:glycoside hydrolase family 43 protein [Puia sp.]
MRRFHILKPGTSGLHALYEVAAAICCLCASCSFGSRDPVSVGTDGGRRVAGTFTNPLLSSGADPWVIRQGTTYYYMNTLGDHLAIRATSRMSELASAKPVTVWVPPAGGPWSKEIWAPELHRFNGKWYLYFAADDGNNAHHRIYALENDRPDPLSAGWAFKGKLADTGADRWAIDASAFQYEGKLYLIWSGWEDTVNIAQNIYIAALADPLTIRGHRVLISSPTQAWEKVGTPPAVNEGPEALINPSTGQLFLTYSASGCWTDSYCLGLLSLRAGGDPLQPADWTKSSKPVFATAQAQQAYAPGHNGYFVSRDGKESWLIYHANSAPQLGCANARSPRMQPFTWSNGGTPIFGIPVRIDSSMVKPGGE